MFLRIATLLTAAVLGLHTEAAFSQSAPQDAAPSGTRTSEDNVKVDSYSLAFLKIGMSEQEIARVLPQLTIKDRGPIRQGGAFVQVPELGDDLQPETQGQAILELTVLDNRLVNISVRWLPISFETMLSSLLRELGEPNSVETTQNVTRGGESFSDTIALWIGERTVIRYFQHFENIKQSRLLIMERPQK